MRGRDVRNGVCRVDDGLPGEVRDSRSSQSVDGGESLDGEDDQFAEDCGIAEGASAGFRIGAEPFGELRFVAGAERDGMTVFEEARRQCLGDDSGTKNTDLHGKTSGIGVTLLRYSDMEGEYSRRMLASRAAKLGFPTIAEVYDRYAALAGFAEGLGGSLLLYAGLDADGVAVAMASNIAGAASLGLEADAGRAKAALRAGVCDFVVNNLDEALRILKNQVRKKETVSVVLTCDPNVMVKVIVERGVQPEVLAFPVKELMERGARLLESAAQVNAIPIRWSVEREGPQWLPVVDKLAVSSLLKTDARTRWIESAPRYLGRGFAGQRYVRMSEIEADAFAAAAREAAQSGAVPVPVTVERDGELVRLDP